MQIAKIRFKMYYITEFRILNLDPDISHYQHNFRTSISFSISVCMNIGAMLFRLLLRR